MAIDRAALESTAEWDGETFEDLDCTGIELTDRVFQRCTFARVRLSEARLEATRFEDCRVVQCDLTMARVARAAFRNVEFTRTKLMGIDWSGVRRLAFAVGFEGCVLTYSSFTKNVMRGCRIVDCKANETSFVEVDLTGAVFTGTDLAGAKFIDSILVDADLSEATGYVIHPQQNRLRGTRFSEEAALALVGELGIVVPGR